jgi:hypothetical protein
MRLASICLIALLGTLGCSSTREKTSATAGRPAPGGKDAFAGENLTVTPIDEPNGTIASANTVSRFVVIDFYLSPMPETGEQMNVYRDGSKVGEIRITGPRQFSNIAADLVAGEAKAGDNVRPK